MPLSFEDAFALVKSLVKVFSKNTIHCYLDFLLAKAFMLRKTLSDDSSISQDQRNQLSSGFFSPSSIQWMRVRGFKYMKLHGSIAYVNGDDFSHERIFSADITKRIPTTFGGYDRTSVPPIVFPWELFDGGDSFISESDFVFFRDAKADKEKVEARTLFNLYDAIWQSARASVQRASKISFVGISMHEYMQQGLKYLFNGKAGDVEVVVANPANGDFRNAADRLHPASLSGHTFFKLKEFAPALNPIQSSTEGGTPYNYEHKSPTGITIRKTFREFIEKEMD